MHSHALTRINDPSLLTSTDSRYHFTMMDALVNLALRGQDSRLVLHRGFAERQDANEGVAFKGTEDTEELYADDVENHANVHKLSRLIQEDGLDFFFTQSCNQSTCRGLRRLREWVTSDTAKRKVCEKYGVDAVEAEEILRKSSASLVQRSWDVFSELWMKYIIYSPEQPLTAIDWAWYRKEFQDLTGNVDHIHSALKTCIDTTTEEGREKVLDKIHGCLAELARYEDLLRLKEQGIISSLDCLREILEDARRFLTHHCNARCQIPKVDEHGNEYYVCKRTSNFMASPTPGSHYIQTIHVQHNTRALEILEELGFAEANSEGYIEINNEDLKLQRHIPRSSKQDGVFSPTNIDLFVRYPSSSNLQYATSDHVSNYLANYVAAVDAVALMNVFPPSATAPDKAKAEVEVLNNTKIASVKHHNEKKHKEEKKKRPQVVGRPLTQMEALAVIQQQNLVTTNRLFLHLPVCPREYRAATYSRYIKAARLRPADLQAILAVTGQTMRLELRFPGSRLFTPAQLNVIRDELEAPLKTDLITHFSMRPPELLFVDNPIEYTRWFVRKSVCPLFDPEKSLTFLKTNLHLRIDKCMWLDGFNYQILLRVNAIRSCLDLLRSRSSLTGRPSGMQPGIIRRLVSLLEKIDQLHLVQTQGSRQLTTQEYNEWTALSSRFLYMRKDRHLPVVWWTPVLPRRKTAFLIQMLLCNGRFTTEYELITVVIC